MIIIQITLPTAIIKKQAKRTTNLWKLLALFQTELFDSKLMYLLKYNVQLLETCTGIMPKRCICP